MTANSQSESVARHFRNGIPALVIGGIAVFLVLYGYLIQPSRLVNWYQSNQSNVSSAFLHEIAADNPNRSVKSVLESARRGRIIHERLLQMESNSPTATLASCDYMIEVAKGLQRWVVEDQGFISTSERETIAQMCSEYLDQSRANLMGLLNGDSKEKSSALLLLSKETLLRASLTVEQSEILRQNLVEASDAHPDDAALATYAAELEIEKLSARLPFKSNALLDQLAERISQDLSLRGILVLATKNVNENPKQIVRLVEKSLADKSLLNSANSVEQQLALIKGYAMVAEWKEAETLLAKVLNSCVLPSYKHYVGTSLTQYFEVLMASQLPVAVPVWCERADLCQNLIVQLSPGELSSAKRLFDVSTAAIKNSPDCISQSLLSSSLSPLKGVIKLLNTSDGSSETVHTGKESDLAANIVAQICVANVNADKSALPRGRDILASLAEKFPENGNAWYALAVMQYKAEEPQKALESARTAQKLLGDLPSILYLIKELDVQQ